MTFGSNSLKLTTPLDPREGVRYIEPVKEVIKEENIGKLYSIIV